MHALQLGLFSWHPTWHLKAAVLEKENYSCLHPGLEAVLPLDSWQMFVYMWSTLENCKTCPKWTSLPRKHCFLSFSLFFPFLHLLFSKVSAAFWYTAVKMKGGLYSCMPRHVDSITLLGPWSWTFSPDNLLRKILPHKFFCVCVFVLIAQQKMKWMKRLDCHFACTGIFVWIKEPSRAGRFSHKSRALWWSLKIFNFFFITIFIQIHEDFCKT